MNLIISWHRRWQNTVRWNNRPKQLLLHLAYAVWANPDQTAELPISRKAAVGLGWSCFRHDLEQLRNVASEDYSALLDKQKSFQISGCSSCFQKQDENCRCIGNVPSCETRKEKYNFISAHGWACTLIKFNHAHLWNYNHLHLPAQHKQLLVLFW